FVGNFLSYLILKYSILYSILAHFVINFIIIVLFMLPILFVDFRKKQYENNKIKLEYTPKLVLKKSKSIYFISKDSIIGENIKFNKLDNYLKVNKGVYLVEHPFIMYDIIIKRKDTLLDIKSELYFLRN